MTRDYVLYHAHCTDGFTAAWAAWRKLGSSAEYIPVSYGDPLPEIPDGSFVWILDFSYPRDVLLALNERCRVVVLDHHKTAEADLGDLDFATFDMRKSGARLAWECFHDEPVPTLVKYVEDRDLWRWKRWNSRAINAAIASFEHAFAVWDMLDTMTPADLAREGQAILRVVDRQTELMARNAKLVHSDEVVPGGGVDGFVPVVNATCFVSDLCHYLLGRYPTSPYAASYYVKQGAAGPEVVYSLRSRQGSDVDVGALAKLMGGGGHKHAAGFSIREDIGV